MLRREDAWACEDISRRHIKGRHARTTVAIPGLAAASGGLCFLLELSYDRYSDRATKAFLVLDGTARVYNFRDRKVHTQPQPQTLPRFEPTVLTGRGVATRNPLGVVRSVASLVHVVAGSHVAAPQVASKRRLACWRGLREQHGVRTWHQAPSTHLAGLAGHGVRGLGPPGTCLHNVFSLVGRYVHPRRRPPVCVCVYVYIYICIYMYMCFGAYIYSLTCTLMQHLSYCALAPYSKFPLDPLNSGR